MAQEKKVVLNEDGTFIVYNVKEVLGVENNLVSILEVDNTSIDLETIEKEIALFSQRVLEWEDVKAQALLLTDNS